MQKLCVFSAFCLALFAVAHASEEFPHPRENFNQHIEQVRHYLLATQMQQRTPVDVEVNLPFQINAKPSVPYQGKYLLVHGLNDSPYFWQDIAKALSSRGFDVRAILLPGHGNSPESQLNIRYEQWMNAVRVHVEFFENDIPRNAPMYLGGFSLGAVLTSKLALENENIAGLFLFSPAYHSSKNHLLRWAALYSKFSPWVFGGMIIEDNPTKYNSIPINGAAQYYRATKAFNKALKHTTIDIPTLVVATMDDSVLDIQKLRRSFASKFKHKNKTLILYGNAEAKVYNGEVIRPSAFPQYRILNQSHLGVISAIDNTLYGANGEQLICNGNDWPTFSACLYSDQAHWFGAQHTPSPDGVPVARTTFNPNMPFVLEQFDRVFMD